MMSIDIKQTLNNLSAMRKAVEALTAQDVFVGVPEDKSGREAGDSISNAVLGYCHEHGVPGHIPARAHLIPGIEAVQDEAVDLLKDAATKAMEGNEAAVGANLNKIGLIAVNSVRAQFASNDWQPLADSTLDRQAVRKDDLGKPITSKKGKVMRKKSRRERGATNPLIDTSQYRKAQTYVIRKRGGGN